MENEEEIPEEIEESEENNETETEIEEDDGENEESEEEIEDEETEAGEDAEEEESEDPGEPENRKEIAIVSSKTASEIDEAREKEYLKRLEAIFFISARFLSMQELISLSDLNPIIIRELIDQLKERYNKDDSSIEIVERNNLWKMDIRGEFSYLANRLASGSSEFSKAEMETLGIIAYKQPIKQSVVIKIRGNKAYDHIGKFVDLQLIKKKKIGHTNELSLADEFYDYFNISDVDGKDFLKKGE